MVTKADVSCRHFNSPGAGHFQYYFLKVNCLSLGPMKKKFSNGLGYSLYFVLNVVRPIGPLLLSFQKPKACQNQKGFRSWIPSPSAQKGGNRSQARTWTALGAVLICGLKHLVLCVNSGLGMCEHALVPGLPRHTRLSCVSPHHPAQKKNPWGNLFFCRWNQCTVTFVEKTKEAYQKSALMQINFVKSNKIDYHPYLIQSKGREPNFSIFPHLVCRNENGILL